MASGSAVWSSRWTFSLAAIGAAVGLGNIWKFPYLAGTSGGGAFVLVYLACAIAIAIPILIAELLIGRRGGGSPPTAMAALARAERRGYAWTWLGWIGAVVGFLIVSFYSVIAGWAMAYVGKAARGEFVGLEPATSSSLYANLLADPLTLTLWHALFMGLNAFILARGLSAGIEAAVRVLMPALFAMLVVLVGYAAVTGAFGAALNFLFAADFSQVNGPTMLLAIGQAFFSIGVAMGLMMMYGAYIPRDISLPRSAITIAVADTGVAMLAGLAIFPLVFGYGLDPAQGPGLIFVTLPIAFGHFPLGSLFACMFFVLLTCAAVTSSIALLEPLTARLAEPAGRSRLRATMLACGGAWVIGLGTVFSFNCWDDVYLLGTIPGFEAKTFFDLIDYLTANILMPLGGMLIALFVGWGVSRASLVDELGGGNPRLLDLWRLLLRFVVPIAIGAVFAANLA